MPSTNPELPDPGPAKEANAEEIETPLEAEAQAEGEHEFETSREFPEDSRMGIVSVNGEDVDEICLERHDHAA